MSAPQALGMPTLPGQTVDVGGRRMHILISGAANHGQPTVVLESELGGNCLDWSMVQPEIAKFARVCSYDRAGLGWSQPGAGTRDAKSVASELHTLLGKAGVQGPLVLVGHSIGGLFAREFADLFPQQVAGMVLIDPSHEDFPAKLKDQGWDPQAMSRSFGVFAVLSRLGFLGLYRLIRGRDVLPAPFRRMSLQDQDAYLDLMGATAFDTMAGEIGAFEASAAQVRSARPLGDKPMAVLTARLDSAPSKVLQELHADLAKTSSRGRHVVVENTSHFIMLDQPGAVVEAIQQVLQDSPR